MQTNACAGLGRRCPSRGMMLIEVLVTIAIITLISSAVGLAAYYYYESSKNKTAHQSADAIRQGVRVARLEDGEDCPSVEAMIGRGVLDEKSARRDPWGNPWTVACDDGRVRVSSGGKDKKLGTEDDIVEPPLGEPEKTPP